MRIILYKEGITRRKINDLMCSLSTDFLYPTPNCDHLQKLKFSPSLPYVFTEYGSIMAANLLNSQQAIHVSIAVVRTFARLREMIAAHKELARRLDELEKKCDIRFSAAFTAIRRLLPGSTRKHKKQIGFTAR